MITGGGHHDNISPQRVMQQALPAASLGEPQAEREERRLLPSTCSAIERRTVMTQPSTRILVLGAGIAGLLFTLRLAGKVARERSEEHTSELQSQSNIVCRLS